MTFLRQSYKQKPKARGPFSAVQSSLFKNAERMGIDPYRISLAMPMWMPGDHRDYAGLNPGTMVGDGISFKNSYLNFSADTDGTDDRINLGSIVSSNPLSCYASQELTVICRIRYDGSTRNAFPRIIDKSSAGSGGNGWYFGYLTSSNYLQFYTNAELINNFTGSINSLIEDQAWHTFILTAKSGEQKLYTQNLTEAQSAACSFPSTTANAAIGNWNHSVDRNWLGDMDGIICLDQVISSESAPEIIDNYYSLFQRVAPISYFFQSDVGGSTAALTGTITSATETDIVTGGKDIVITLTGDTFVTGTTSEDGIADGMAGSASFNSEVTANTDNTDIALSTTSVANDTATITLPPAAGYSISSNDTITVTIPAASLTTSTEAIVASPTATITQDVTGVSIPIAMYHYMHH